ncbi:FAD-dependent oxidoreductase [Legionella sp. D16C41]|uniref:FAD-dependent oxidoreductase n=1 Tax=Legionella sp. D16C41 TaxID=3402688 RepID=UPI003AF9C09B
MKIVIIGAGPAGLAMAASLTEEIRKAETKSVDSNLKAAVSSSVAEKADDRDPSTSYEISIVEKRDLDFKRRQKLIITPDKQKTLLTQLTTEAERYRWDDYCQHLFDPEHKLSVDKQGNLLEDNKIIEDLNQQKKFLRKLLRQQEYISPFFKTFKNFSIKELQKALKEYLDNCDTSKTNINWHERAKIIKCDLDKKILHTVNANGQEQQLEFDHLIICEGERREVVQQINEELKKTTEPKLFTYKPMGKKTYHAAARLIVKNKENKDYRTLLDEIRIPMEDRESIADEAEKLGWDPLASDPMYIADTNLYKDSLNDDKSWQPRLFIAAEIPEYIHLIVDENKKREAILNWLSIFASNLTGIPRDHFDIDTKGEDAVSRLNAVTFCSDMKYVDNPVYIHPNGASVITIGDCAMSSHYRLGFSSAMAMNQGRSAAKCIVANQHLAEQKERFKPLETLYNTYVNLLYKMVDSGVKPSKLEKN